MSRTRLAVFGANGRMGRAVVRLAAKSGAFDLVAAVGSGDIGRDVGELAGIARSGVVVTDAIDALARSKAEVVIDFSAPAALPGLLGVVTGSGAALVSGTTGFDDAAIAELARGSERVAVLWEPNMSLGVHVLGDLLRRAIAALGGGFDIEITETHHRLKVDAPSGTALRLAEIAREGRAGAPLVHGRSGRPGARPEGEIGMHALRGGDVIGDHTVHLFGDGERLELTHRASNRDLFASGAVRAAAWIAGRPAGRYSLADVLSGR